MAKTLTPISTVHSPVLFSLSKKKKGCLRDKRFWKFHSFLTKDQNYVIKIEKLIRHFGSENKSLFHLQLKWELFKCEVLKVSINYAKHLAKEKDNKEKFRIPAKNI